MPVAEPADAWQFSCDVCPFCHSWQSDRKRSVTAMFMVILLAALSLAGIASTIAALRSDGYRRTPTDWSRLS
ncbi:hypothetical protein GCM10009777_06360 [Microbacterium pumilum]|uniref:Uncharacterized protein n=1 Tax=Microbacterium pumilum TaxID=344165 RepID=A0ABN2RWF5_9MICO